jgi:tyrosinase
MKFILKINGTESPNAVYVGWTPVRCALTVEEYAGIASLNVTITTGHLDDPKKGEAKGRLSLYTSNATSSTPVDKIAHDFQKKPKLEFYVAGKYPEASVAREDTYIEITSQTGEIEPIRVKFMVRVRKNANKLDHDEKELFLKAFTTLSESNTATGEYKGRYTVKPCSILDEIVLMHTYDAQNEIHGRESFHPWHRAYLMHLEREMQAKFPQVNIPYWKFDSKAENVFTEEFIGKTCKLEFTDLNGDEVEDADEFGERYFTNKIPKFSKGNPMIEYKDHTIWGPLTRSYQYEDPALGKSNPDIADEEVVISYSDQFIEWCNFEERKSHNQAHRAFSGRLVDVGKDPVDPLFFLMHSNVDRIWALWQHTHNRFDADYSKTYPLPYSYNGKAGKEWAEANFIKFDLLQGIFAVDKYDLGNFANDELWPWGLSRKSENIRSDEIDIHYNETKDDEKDTLHRLSRPWRRYAESSYGSAVVPELFLKFPESSSAKFPEKPPRVRDMIDYQGRLNPDCSLGFDYDDVPYFDDDKKNDFEPRPRITRKEENERFLNKSLTVDERLESAKKAIIFTPTHNSAVLALIADKEENIQIRIQAVKLVNVDNRDSLDALLLVLELIVKEINTSNASNEFVELARELIHKIFAAKRSNLHFPSCRPMFFNILRGLIRGKNLSLRLIACEILASQNDGVAIDFLYEQASNARPNAVKYFSGSKPLVSAANAILLLRLNPKDQHTDLYNKIIKENKDTEVRVAAISGLSNASEYKEDLEQIFKDESEEDKIRWASAKTLLHLDRDRMINLAAQNIAESKSGDIIKLFRSVTPDSDEVNFKAGLLNMLTYTGDVERLKQNEGLKSTLKEVVDSSIGNKTNFRSSSEAFNTAPFSKPTTIEHMAAKLLSRLEMSDNE